MKRTTVRRRGVVAVTSALLSVVTFTGAGTAEAWAAGCTFGSGPTWTSSVCTTLNNGTHQRAAHYCSSPQILGYMYGLPKTTPNATSATPNCYGNITQRQVQIW